MATYKVSFADKTRAVELEADDFRFAGGNQFIVFRKKGKDKGGPVAAWPVERVSEIRLLEQKAQKTSK